MANKPDPEQLILELTRFSDFGEQDMNVLRSVCADLDPYFKEMADYFYQFIQGNKGSRDVLLASGVPVDALKLTLAEWAKSLFTDKRDKVYAERRLIIGEKHAKIGIPQKYVLGAIQIVRSFFEKKLAELNKETPAAALNVIEVMNRALDLDINLICESYHYSTQM